MRIKFSFKIDDSRFKNLHYGELPFIRCIRFADDKDPHTKWMLQNYAPGIRTTSDRLLAQYRKRTRKYTKRNLWT